MSQLQRFQFVSSAKKNKKIEQKKNLQQLNAWNDAASVVSPVQNYSRRDGKASLQSSVRLWIKLDHPSEPVGWFTGTCTHIQWSTHCAWAIQHGDPVLSAPLQLCLLISSGLLSLFWRCSKTILIYYRHASEALNERLMKTVFPHVRLVLCLRLFLSAAVNVEGGVCDVFGCLLVTKNFLIAPWMDF